MLETGRYDRASGSPPEDTSDAVLARLAALIARHLPTSGDHVSTVPGLTLFRRDGFCSPLLSVLEPGLSLVVQGGKRVAVRDETYDYETGCFALTSVALPAFSQIFEGGADYPFLSLSLKIDPAIVREVSAEIDRQGRAGIGEAPGVVVSDATYELLDAIARLTKLEETPQDFQVLEPLLRREIVYRLLTGPAGNQLREVAAHGTPSHRIATVVAWMSANFADPVRVEDLAQAAAMAVSTFHLHFKAVTRMSPLQYQKQIRLHEARRLLLTESIDAGSAALRVGYESVTQFSREYRRMFGNPPMRDILLARSF